MKLGVFWNLELQNFVIVHHRIMRSSICLDTGKLFWYENLVVAFQGKQHVEYLGIKQVAALEKESIYMGAL